MKTLSKSFLLVFTAVNAFSVWAYGVERMGWERPVARAELREWDATGHEVRPNYTKELIQSRLGGNLTFTFVEEIPVRCVTAPCPPMKQTTRFYQTRPARKDGCGSVIHEARTVATHPAVPAQTLILVDHTQRRCDDDKPELWEVTIDVAWGQRKLSGTPTPFYTIQGGSIPGHVLEMAAAE